MHIPRHTILLSGVIGLSLGACSPDSLEEESLRNLETSIAGEVDGQEVTLFTLTNASGAQVSILEYGGIVTRLEAPDAAGILQDVVLGFDDLDSYIAGSPYFGAITGRYANRIAGGRFELEGVEYELPVNNGPNSLHGGIKGFDKVVWEGTPAESGDGVELTYVSVDGEEGYPGTLTTKVTYTWTDDHQLRISYEATTDKPTVVNLTNHSYFNLEDGGAGSILGHDLTINASSFTPVDETSIPNGEIAPLDGTPLDFRETVAVGDRIGDEHQQLEFGAGYDHNYVLDRTGTGLELAATVRAPVSGRIMEVLTTEPGVQFYSGNFLDGSHIGKRGVAYEHRSGLCLETQHYPDSPNQPDFPSTVLRPGETYASQTVYKFTAE